MEGLKVQTLQLELINLSFLVLVQLQSNTLTGSMTVTVIRVYPNGNLEIKGQKKLILNDGSEYLRLSGIIRPEDISGNTISSSI